MFHKALKLEFKTGTSLEILFQNGEIKSFDVSCLFEKYPQMKALQDRQLFLSGKLVGKYGIIWNDELDLETETVFEAGKTVGYKDIPVSVLVGEAVYSARARAGLSQTELAKLTNIDQSDISKIERGASNPSVQLIARIAAALNMKLNIEIK